MKKNENSKNSSNELDKEITVEELKKAAKKIRLNKAAYSDKVTNEMLKASIDILANAFIKVFNTVLNSGQFPSSCCDGLITPIFKSGFLPGNRTADHIFILKTVLLKTMKKSMLAL